MNKEIIITLAKVAIIAAAVLLASSATSRSEDKASDLKQRILAQAQGLSENDYAFTRTVKTEQTSNGKTEKRTSIDKFDPSKLGDARWTLISVDGAAPPEKDLTQYGKDSAKRTVPGYFRLAKYFGAASTVSTDARGRTVFHFASLPKDSAIVFGSDVSSNTSAEVTVAESNGTAFAEQVHLNVKPVRLKLVMKLERYESTSRYRLGPDGKPVLSEQTAEMSGSGLGQEGQVHNVITYSDYRPAK